MLPRRASRVIQRTPFRELRGDKENTEKEEGRRRGGERESEKEKERAKMKESDRLEATIHSELAHTIGRYNMRVRRRVGSEPAI